ncbi:hypothetical protein CBR_g40260 [Chara braunii]|uniref:Uncharacterized protein n=1 Tax=Chara braunii TaxID=69332 RepID=A0A388K1X6_CHABU|nr:hypothetical protein CBR_g40260 [Chara braunii]|eukprot:GBG64015.1 hypothetical protein CBR_g40260 [Chara braunii]
MTSTAFPKYEHMATNVARFQHQSINEVRISALCANLVLSLVTRYRLEQEAFQPFPDNDETLEKKANEAAKKLGGEFMETTRDFSGTSAVEESRKELSRAMEAEQAHMLRRNTALMTALCFDPLTNAYRELRMQDCERTFENMWRTRVFWSTKCLWPGPAVLFGFKVTAYRTARRHLDQAQRHTSASTGEGSERSAGYSSSPSVSLSDAMKYKVIMTWIDHDLAKHANLVLTNFMMVMATIGAIVIGGIWFAWKILAFFGSGTSPPIRSIPPDYYPDSADFLSSITKGIVMRSPYGNPMMTLQSLKAGSCGLPPPPPHPFCCDIPTMMMRKLDKLCLFTASLCLAVLFKHLVGSKYSTLDR